MDEANVHGTSAHAPDASPDYSAVPSTSHEASQSCQAKQQQQLDYGTPEVATVIDTAAPIDSVKGAVTKFGAGAVIDWREKRKHVEDELDTVQAEITEYQKRTQEAEAGRAEALRELGTAVSAADELGLGLEKARAEEAHARQQADHADLQLEETQRAAAAAELDGAMVRRAGALEDLRAARAEAEALEKVRARAKAKADSAAARAMEAAAAAREAGNAVEELADEVLALKAELESSRAAHVAAEEKRMGLAVKWEEDKSRWQTELEEGEMEAKRLRERLMAACDVEMKVEKASELLASLEAQLFASCAVEDAEERPTVSSSARSSSVLEKTKKELDDVKASVEKAKDEAQCLRLAAVSLRGELETEKAELTALRQREKERERERETSVSYLEEELRRATAELAAAEAGAKAGGGDERKMAERVGEARREAEEAKAKARAAREEVARARKDAGVAKATVAAMEARLEAVAREIVAANTAAQIATASASALLQSENEKAQEDGGGDGGGGVTLTVAEYGELSRRAREMEEAAGLRVTEAVKLIKEAKDAEVRSLEKVARAAKQTEQRRQAMEASTLEAEEAEFEKLSAERELRQWRAEHDHDSRRTHSDIGAGSPRPGLAEISVLDDPVAGDGRGNPHILSPRGGYMPRTELMAASTAADADADARQKKTFLPRMVMFLARRRAQTWK